jgi:hypothetical protein
MNQTDSLFGEFVVVYGGTKGQRSLPGSDFCGILLHRRGPSP